MILRQFTISFKKAFSRLFLRKQKGARFFSDRKILTLLNHCSFICKTVYQFFWILILSQDFLGNVHHVWNQHHFLLKSDKTIYLPGKTNLKKFETWYCRRTTAENYNVKVNASLNIPCTFLLFKTITFPQIFFPRNSSFKFCTAR